MTTLASLVAAYTRIPTATCYINNQRWYEIQKLSTSAKFGQNISTGSIDGRNPPVVPLIGMPIRWTWGYNGLEASGFTGEISDITDYSYPDRWQIAVKDVLWRADKSNQVLATDPLNSILASVAVKYLLTHFGGISSSRLNIPVLPASGAAWAGSEWTLGILTPVQWGDSDTGTGGTTALRAAAEICSCLGYWLYADTSGIIRAKQMERKPSLTARETFQRDVNLLVQGAPERKQSYDWIYNQVSVRGADTGVDGAQLFDQSRTTFAGSLIPAGVYRDFAFSSFLLEYENAIDAGAASVTEVTKRILTIMSRIPDVISARAKADPNRKVGDTVGIIDANIAISTQKNYFIYAVDRVLDLNSGSFDDTLSLDGGTGNSGFTTVPPPDAAFSWQLMAETLDGTAVVEVMVDGSGSTSPSGEIVTYAWSTVTTVYSGTPTTATGVTATFIFAASSTPADITLTVTDTTSKTATFEALIDLTGADTATPMREVVSGAAGAAWYVTPDGGATWHTETSNGDAIAVGTIGAGADSRASGTAGTYGLVATRGSGGAGGLRQTLDTLASASTNLVSNSSAITSNIWINEGNPARIWFAIGAVVYRSIDGGVTKTAMASAASTVTWIMEDAAVDNSIFLLAGANMYNATDPTVGYALLYSGPIGATAKQFVRSRDGLVTWVCYTGAPSGQALQRVETGALADLATTDIQTLALDRNATSLVATLYAITLDNPAQLWIFNGITGLEAVASSQTFPSGATVQHMLTSRLFNVIYTADFDSVAPSQGAFRKYFPQADRLLLWKQLAAGQQGHMLGLGARASAPAEVLRMTIAVDPGGVWHYRDSVWTFLPLPQAGTVRGITISADPFNPDRWLAVFNNNSTQCFNSGGVIHGDGWAHSPLWETENAGITWTEVVITTPAAWQDGCVFTSVVFNDLTANSWAACFGNGGPFYTAIVLGTSATVTSVAESSGTVSCTSITGGAEAEWLLGSPYAVSSTDGTRYLDTSSVFHTPAGTPVLDVVSIDREPGVSRRAYVTEVSTNNIHTTSDYRAAQPTVLFSGVNAESVAAIANTIYYHASGGNCYRVVDPIGIATSTLITSGSAKTIIRTDRQTRTLAGCAVGGGALVDNGTTTIFLPAAADEGFLASNGNGCPNSFEIMVRA